MSKDSETSFKSLVKVLIASTWQENRPSKSIIPHLGCVDAVELYSCDKLSNNSTNEHKTENNRSKYGAY